MVQVRLTRDPSLYHGSIMRSPALLAIGAMAALSIAGAAKKRAGVGSASKPERGLESRQRWKPQDMSNWKIPDPNNREQGITFLWWKLLDGWEDKGGEMDEFYGGVGELYSPFLYLPSEGEERAIDYTANKYLANGYIDSVKVTLETKGGLEVTAYRIDPDELREAMWLDAVDRLPMLAEDSWLNRLAWAMYGGGDSDGEIAVSLAYNEVSSLLTDEGSEGLRAGEIDADSIRDAVSEDKNKNKLNIIEALIRGGVISPSEVDGEAVIAWAREVGIDLAKELGERPSLISMAASPRGMLPLLGTVRLDGKRGRPLVELEVEEQ